MGWICRRCETQNPNRLKICEVCDNPRKCSPLDKLKEKYKGARFRNFLRSDKNCKLLASADNNDADAQFEVGEWFYGRKTGGSSEENDKEAVIWFKKAALQGHVTAQYYLALCYENGRGTPQIKDEAQKWFNPTLTL